MIRFTWKVGDFILKRKGNEAVLYAPRHVLPILDGTISHNLCPKKCLTTSKTVVYGGVFKLRGQPGNH